eukprot:TRINITY_DN66854_c0_g1_i1.p1 TRINITY_DN66854_c0_g1~~TRINITY_DN66854_c0_g1_i1.p1  ORF type:complete len:104 (+),score=9.30 TRINITY_DN66854_c0_g1_i1:421-732(+)
MKLNREFIEKLPKTDLHVHLDGSVRVDTILDLAKKNKIKLPTMDRSKLLSMISCGDECKSLEEYLQGFHITNLVLPMYSALICLLYTSPSPRDLSTSRMPSSA